MQVHDPKIQAEYLEQVGSMFGGAELVAVAKKRNVRIIETDEWNLSRWGQLAYRENASFDILINAKITQEAKNLAALHELRHVLQMDDFDRCSQFLLSLGGKTAKNSHLLTLMTEADAITTQAFAALQCNKQDAQTGYLTLMKKRRPSIEKLLNAKNFQADEHFSRQLFVDLMISGLEEHHKFYREYIENHLIKAPLKVENGRIYFGYIPDVETPVVSPKITNLYGAEFMSGTSLRAIETAFMRTLPLSDRILLRKYEKMLNALSTMPQEEYADKLASLSAEFSKTAQSWSVNSVSQTPEIVKRKALLESAAIADLPLHISKCLVTRRNLVNF